MYECIAAIQGCWWVWITIRNDSCWVLLEDIVPLHLVCQTVTTLPFLILHWINVENAWLDVTLTSIGWADECHNYCLKDDICALQFYPSACVSIIIEKFLGHLLSICIVNENCSTFWFWFQRRADDTCDGTSLSRIAGVCWTRTYNWQWIDVQVAGLWWNVLMFPTPLKLKLEEWDNMLPFNAKPCMSLSCLGLQ